MKRHFTSLGSARQAFLGRAATAAESRWAEWLGARDLPLEWLALATEIAELDTRASSAAKEAVFDMCILVQTEEHRGSTRLNLAALEEALGFFGPQTEESKRAANIRRLFEDMNHCALGDASIDHNALLVRDGTAVYSRRLLQLEDRVVASLMRRIAAPAKHSASAVAASYAACAFDPQPSASQQEAISVAAERRLTVITGGPGTGKTTVVGNLLRLVRALNPKARIALAAPTGKAAHRLQLAASKALSVEADGGQDTPAPAQTLHRLLGFSPRNHSFRHSAEHPVEADFIVVDEASMVDLWLMSHLLAAVSAECQLVLLGDADQLPSVDAGQVLKDVTGAQQHTVTLQDNFRMRSDDPAGQHLAECARLAHAGSADLFEQLHRVKRYDQLRFEGASWLDAKPEQLGALLEHFDTKKARPEAGPSDRFIVRVVESTMLPEHEQRVRQLLAAQSRARILTLTRRPSFARSSGAANQRLHGQRAQLMGLFEAPSFLPAEPVIVSKNDYERGLFNGDQGVVVRMAVDQEPVQPFVVFERDGELLWHPLARLAPQLELGHASTVHRAQGSEFDHVLLLMPERDVGISTRELLYTAITRARRSVTIVASKDSLQSALSRVVRRDSGIAEKLSQP